MVTFLVLRHKERDGHLPFMKAKHDLESDSPADREAADTDSAITPTEEKNTTNRSTESNIAEVHSASS